MKEICARKSTQNSSGGNRQCFPKIQISVPEIDEGADDSQRQDHSYGRRMGIMFIHIQEMHHGWYNNHSPAGTKQTIA